MRGRKPKPQKEKRILDFPGKRKPRRSRSSKKATVCPRGLTQEARKVWEEVAPAVLDLQTCDRAQLADYCTLVARLHYLERKIMKEGYLVNAYSSSKNPVKKKNPLLQIAREYRSAMQRWASEFGLTPVSRQRLGLEPAMPEDDDVLDGNWEG